MALTEVFRALSDPTRRAILRMLADGDLAAGEIAEAFAISKPSISHHLNVLKQAGLVRDERRGQQIIYSLESTVFDEVVGWMFDLVQKGERRRRAAGERGTEAMTQGGYRLDWKEMRREWPAWILLLAVLAFGAAAYPRLPERVPIHWNLAGEPDGYGSPLLAAFGLPLLNIGLYLLLLVLPLIDPKRENYARFSGFYRGFRLLFAAVMSGIGLAALYAGLGNPLDVGLVTVPAISVLFLFIGNSLGRVRPNYFVGIRTPWTLADDEVWRRTHRVGGRLFVLIGLLPLLALPFSRPASFVLLAGGVCLTAAWTMLYSYLIYRKRAR